MDKKNILVTGGAGFIGSNFIRYLLHNSRNYSVVNLDGLTYAGNLANLDDVRHHFPERYKFVKGDICDAGLIRNVIAESEIEWIVNFAAESHVDRSIMDSAPFVRTNVIGAHALLESSVQTGVEKFMQISTDEVYGSLPEGFDANEMYPLAPSSPYAASKASADMFALSYWKTFRLPVVITRSSNNYGAFQFPEKFIPLMISNALEDEQLPIYGDGKNIRDWTYVEDNCRAIMEVMIHGRPGAIYNIGGGNHWHNIDVAKLILKILGKSERLITFVKDRLGHDFRYSIDCSLIKNDLSWEPSMTFEAGLEKTIEWYRKRQDWVRSVKTKEYMDYYKRQYSL